ncbi:E3 ubiquitin-protein ligase MARCHF2-like [Rhipicephalus sanguineus]|uniref:E3 ubiquitin-protein ligase MARCHF2-like n=1 Tax=Rhipicephalus sanguineus TaxID=34632 RepID=UPI0018959385|nr:E3 ubiquitin-protein ligase MARCHF2-like [Rhipicephalus sanguineus]
MAEDRVSPKRTEADKAEEAAVAPGPLEKLENHADQVCRICYGEADLENGPLLQPCACKGTIAFVHKECIEGCLREWGDICTICRTRMKARRKGAPLRHFFRGFINRKDMVWIAVNGAMFAGEVAYLVHVWIIVMECLGSLGWTADLLVYAGLVLFTATWTMLESVRWTTCHERYEAWKKRTLTVELIIHHLEAQKGPLNQAAQIAVDTEVPE